MQVGDRIVSYVTFDVTKKMESDVIDRLAATVRDRLSRLAGFREALLLIDESRKRIVVASEWESRQDWAAAEWDTVVQDTVVDVFKETASYDVQILYPLLRVGPP